MDSATGSYRGGYTDGNLLLESDTMDVSTSNSKPIHERGYKIEVKDFIKEGHEKADLSQFKLLKTLGQGSYGIVYLVKKIIGLDNGKLYAMKVLKDEAFKSRDKIRAQIQKEGDILANIQHPFIVQLHYAFETEGKFYLILNYLRGGDLFTQLTNECLFIEENAQFYLAETALALDYIHSLGIIYRDLKPENLLLDANGHVSLTDFGLSKSIINDKKTNTFCGTIDYMAPEIINHKDYTFSADWWSFGVLMYEMLTGYLPFDGTNRNEIMNQIVHSTIEIPENLSYEAQSLLSVLLKRNPKNRISNILQIKNHEFFSTVNWDKLYAKDIYPPYVPIFTSAIDANIFESQHASKTPKDSNSADNYEAFEGFDSVTSCLADEDDILNLVQSPHKPVITTEQYSKLFGKKRNIANEYELKHEIGRGTNSSCRLCVNKITHIEYTVKIIDKLYASQEEIDILLRYEHKNIVSLKDVYEDDKFVYLVMEYMRGGLLLDRLQMLKCFSEREASAILHVIVLTIQYLHTNGVVHRDLKLSKILCSSNSISADTIKISDFGFAKQFRTKNSNLMALTYTDKCATPEEIRKQSCAIASDIWSLGILLYTLLAGHIPNGTHLDDSQQQELNHIYKINLDFESGNWKIVSDDAKDLVKKLLHTDPYQRPTADQILSSPWIMNRDKLPTQELHWQGSSNIKEVIEITYQAVCQSQLNLDLGPVGLFQLPQI